MAGTLNPDGTCQALIDSRPAAPPAVFRRFADSIHYDRRNALNPSVAAGEDIHFIRWLGLGFAFRARIDSLLAPGRYPIVPDGLIPAPRGYAMASIVDDGVTPGLWPFAKVTMSLDGDSGVIVLDATDSLRVTGRFRFVAHRRSTM